MNLENRRVLVFSAHAADFCSRAGGTIARLVDADSAVAIYDLSYGEKCESATLWAENPDLDIEEVKRVRREEIEAAAAVLGAPVACMDYGDSPVLVGPERRLQILDIVRQFRPDLCLTHWRDDFVHPDHVETTHAAYWATRYCFRPGLKTAHPPCPAPEVLCYETVLGMAPITRFVPNLFVDITSVQERKTEALSYLATQPDLPERYEMLARYRALEAQSTAWMKDCHFAEGFVRVGTEAVP